MNRCDYTQGRDCPAKVAKYKPMAQEPLPTPAGHLKKAATVMLVALGVALIVCFWIVLIAASAVLVPERRIIDCSLASFHPDFTPAMREACRKAQ